MFSKRNSKEKSLHFCMDTYSMPDKNSSQAPPGVAPPRTVPPKPAATKGGAAAAPAMARESLRFPGEDGGKSLSEMAQRDLDATLQLLAERAQYITGASGVAIALREGKHMVCCASAGPSAPEMGTHMQIDSGLSAESVRSRKTLHCEDAENDARVNRESCRALGIASVVVMPLVRDEEVFGVFELLAGRPHAFEERDFTALQRLSEMIQTAVELAEAARRAEKELGSNPPTASPASATTHPGAGTTATPAPALSHATAETVPAKIVPADIPEKPAAQAKAAEAPAAETNSASAETAEAGTAGLDAENSTAASAVNASKFGVRSCESCGFPISEGRRLCLDCEAASPAANAIVSAASQPFAEPLASESNWIRSNLYLVAAAILLVATIAVVVWRF
jgi:putative methionine-R-sulfoxide reductase with GAF domain